MSENQAEKHPKLRAAGRIILTILFVFFAFLGSVVALAVRWESSMWSDLKMDEIIFELTAPLEGTGNNMITDVILKVAVPSVLIAVAAAGLCFFLKMKKKRKLYVPVAAGGAILFCLIGFSAAKSFFDSVEFWKWLENRNSDSEFIENYYANPDEVTLTFPEQKRNLIYIYLESMEVTFSDYASGGAFDKNVIAELTELAQENEDFSGADDTLNGGYSLPGTTWTIGAMFAQTSGLPLQTDLGDNAMNTQTEFFSGVTTLGDILQKNGYKQTLMIGSDATFGGRELYFTTHGNYTMRDYDYAMANGIIPEGYKVFWGFEDERLFKWAKEWLSDEANTSEPFNLTMLTVDTHFPDGYVCDLCGTEYGDDQYSNVISCSSRQVVEFVRWIQQQPFYENTTIVISGDHPTMDVDYCDNIDPEYTRKVYTTYINSAIEPMLPDERREFSTFDQFPTTLAAMGVQIGGDRLGLGTNLFSTSPTYSEIFGTETLSDEVAKKSTFLSNLAQISEEEKEDVLAIQNSGIQVFAHQSGDVMNFYAYGVNEVKDKLQKVEMRDACIYVYAHENEKPLWGFAMKDQGDGFYYGSINILRFEDITDCYFAVCTHTTYTRYQMTGWWPLHVDYSVWDDPASITYGSDAKNGNIIHWMKYRRRQESQKNSNRVATS